MHQKFIYNGYKKIISIKALGGLNGNVAKC